MAIRHLKWIWVVLMIIACSSLAHAGEVYGKVEFYGKQFINFELGSVLNIVVADNIDLTDKNEGTATNFMGRTPLDLYRVSDKELNFMLSMMLSEKFHGTLRPSLCVFNPSGKLIIENILSVDVLVAEDRNTWNFRIPTEPLKDLGMYFVQIYLPIDGKWELLLSWPLVKNR